MDDIIAGKDKYFLFIADCHLGHIHVLRYKTMLDKIKKKLDLINGHLAAIILAGDLAEHYKGVEECVAATREAFPTTAILGTLGNHDLSPYLDSMNADRKYYTEMPALFKRYGGIFMDHAEPWIYERTAVVGNIGWYDFAARNHTHGYYPAEYWQVQKWKMRFEPDCQVKWKDNTTDIEFATRLRLKTVEHLESLENNQDIDNVIVFNHHPQFYEEVLYQREYYFNRHSKVLDVYFYNPNMGKALLPFTKVKLAVAGHIHVYTKTDIPKPDGTDLLAYTIGSEYGKPGYLLIDANDFKKTVANHDEKERNPEH